jgi:hypothetical protein
LKKALILGFLITGVAPATLPAQNVLGLPKLGSTQTAAPLTTREKFNYRMVQMFGLKGLAGASVGAAIGQARDAPHEWGQGAVGFADRYVSSVGGTLTRNSMEFAIESVFHEDPRYFPSTEKGFKARLKNVLLQTVVTRTDSGRARFAYARVGSAFANSQLVNAWQPPSTGGVGDGVIRGLISLGADAGYNFLQEFVSFLRPKP